jgi:PST family polysaccharide transporter
MTRSRTPDAHGPGSPEEPPSDPVASPSGEAGAEPPEAPRDSSLRAGSDAFVIGLGYLASFAYPLVSLPLLSRILGAHDLGRFMLALVLVQLVVQFSDFGFGRSALRRIAVATTEKERSHVVFATLGGIGLLWFSSSAVLMAFVLIVPGMREQWLLYAVGLLLVGIGVTYPKWLLQGMGRLRSFALLMSMSRLIALVFLVLTVRTPDDLLLAMLWQQFPLALSALASWFMVLLVWRDIHVVRTTFSAVRGALAESWPMFVANLSNVVISSSNTVVLGIVSTPVHVAYFGSAERFGNAVRGIMHGIVDAMLPRMTRSGEAAHRIERAIMAGIIGTYALAGIVMILAAPAVIPWYLGQELAPAALVTQIIGISLMISGVQMAMFLRATAQHRFRTVARCATTGAIVHVLLLFPAGWMFGSAGAAAVAIVSEGTIAVLFLIDTFRSRRRASGAATPAAGPAAESPNPRITTP